MKYDKIIAVYSIDVHNSICIYDIEYGIDDKVIYKWLGEGNKLQKAIIRYNRKGEAFFISYNRRYYLKDFYKIVQ